MTAIGFAAPAGPILVARRLTGAAAAALAASGLLTAAGFLLHPEASTPESVQSARWLAAHALFMGSIALVLPGLTGFYLRQADALGAAGLAAWALACLGLLGNFAEVTFEAIYNPALAALDPGLVARIGDGSGLVPGALLTAASGALFVLGYAGLGLLTWRARRLDRRAGLAMAAGALLFALAAAELIPPPWLLVGPLAYLAMQLAMASALLRAAAAGASPLE